MDRNPARTRHLLLTFSMLAALTLGLSGCFGKSSDGGSATDSPATNPSSSPTPESGGGGKSVNVSWSANRETAVNSSGGGYRIYYSSISGFSTGSASFVDAPFVSGSAAPTTATLTGLSSGTYYIKVVAYSSMGTSSSSSESSVTIP